MKIIQWLSDKISEEIGDGSCYAEKALLVRDEYPDLANVLNRISQEEMNHMSMLHNEVAKIIAQYRKEHGEPPASMLAVYDYKHKEQIEDARDVKALQLMFQEKISP